jgi:hypothetical protein
VMEAEQWAVVGTQMFRERLARHREKCPRVPAIARA